MSVIAVTGANGFIGKNLVVRLGELGHDVRPLNHALNTDELAVALSGADRVIHLAGVNRPQISDEFVPGNVGMTQRLIEALHQQGEAPPIFYASSIQAERDTPYGHSKLAAEAALLAYADATGNVVTIARLPNVFGKWCRPNYNSVVATFCHNISHGLPITVNDPASTLSLVYIDDVVQVLIDWCESAAPGEVDMQPVYVTTLGELSAQLQSFRDSRTSLVTGAVGKGFLRALHATYVSYLDPADFAYPLVAHTDARGSFVEMLRTPDAGQFSFFTAHPGITRGGHYHHSKTEKFLVIQGSARFGFRHILTDETFEVFTSDAEPRVVETIPGWSHDITNIGDTTMVVMLWANELFDPARPDTIAAKVLS